MSQTGRACVAEAIGTFGLCFIGAGSIILDAKIGGGVGLIGIALAHGVILSIMISALGGVSGGHFNPAVTIGFLVTKKQEVGEGISYIVSQLVGGTVAGLLLRAIYAPEVWQKVHLGTPMLGEGVSVGTGILVEIVLTFFLVTAIWGTAVDDRKPDIGGFGIGLTLTADILMGGPLTGASMNPARTFGPALAGGGFDSHLVYWIGPIIGAVIAAVLYNNILIKKD
ncbi:MAG: aquaporin [Nitrospinota bacterium]|jgi:MIP family channel proteins|nr:aquaporin [Nitrospinota bacterium]MDP6364972.1 aquaporin [Nitrospinota bacterium]MDP7168115.1 aquaporin [Nitrospinota bacterium]MDP7369002.1 aquaporin [Nitrospinota bacterium]MDP7502782.1 aquaporin [Nitrospinota bacterium]|tara:strand:+ start:368 stop:1042 length:675 start_codon:yes stop_codon:yes gene_type:complete